MAAVDHGGGYHGPPRRWTGTGPRPARHIPWPELFKHHQSVLTGHLKMMDMVRKHCVEGTGNYNTAQACVERTQEMLRMFKRATATFVPPRNKLEKVPLGASSASMYPGYSPADHIYGEAAAEYGQQVAEAKRKGVKLDENSNGPEYVIGQGKLGAREQLEEIKKQREADMAKTREGNPTSTPNDKVESQGTSMDGVEQDGSSSQLFTIDSNPTPVDVLQGKLNTSSHIKGKNKANDKVKRRVSFQDEQQGDTTTLVPTESHKRKKAKATSDKSAKVAIPTPAIEQEDISGEVDARHKIKEEKRKKAKKAEKEGKKRKRESEVSQLADEAAETRTKPADVPGVEAEVAKPEKKKLKLKADGVGADVVDSAVGNSSDGTTSKKNKKKKKRDILDAEVEATGSPAEGEKQSKKRKKKAAD